MQQTIEQSQRKRQESGHTPRPVVWSQALWEHVEARRVEAEVLRRIHKTAEADAHDAETDRLVDVLMRAEGDVWVDTTRAVQVVQAALGDGREAKADTVRSWARRGRIRARKTGGDWLYHRDDLLMTSDEVARRKVEIAASSALTDTIAEVA